MASNEIDPHSKTFSSDEDFDDEEAESEVDDSESDTDVDAKIAEDDIFDAEFLKCYSALKRKDEKIYNKDVKFFEPEPDSDDADQDGDHEKPSKSEPKMTILDHQLNLNQDEVYSAEAEAKIDLNQPVDKSYYEKELEEIKKNIESVTADIDSDDEELLTVKKGSGSDTEPVGPSKRIGKLLEKIEQEDDDEDFKHLKEIWANTDKLSKEDKFLRDYIMNKMYLPQNVARIDAEDKEFFSKNLDDLSDADEEEKPKKQKHVVDKHSDEKNFDRIARIPRNATTTIRDLDEKRKKKEKRLKTLEKEKKHKKSLKNADCEDVVGDMPIKFHYVETEPNDYGLTAEELLMADDEELDKWIRLNDAIKPRTKDEEERLKRKFDRRRDDIELKKKIFKSIYQPESATDEIDETKPKASKSARKRKRRKTTADDESNQNELEVKPVKKERVEKVVDNEATNIAKKKKRKRGVNHKKEKFAKVGVAPDRLLAYGLSKTKLRKNKLL